MKEKDLYVDDKRHEIILFAEKDDASYAPIKSGSYITKHYLGEYYKLKENLDRALREDMKQGRISPVYYFMTMQDIGIGDLAGRIGISKRKLRKHFRPEVFARLGEEMLEKYAVVFGVTVEEVKRGRGEFYNK